MCSNAKRNQGTYRADEKIGGKEVLVDHLKHVLLLAKNDKRQVFQTEI